MLVFNPEKRPSAESCLKHSYVARFHSKKDNLDVGYNVIPPINDDIQLTVDEYRQRLYAMIQVKINKDHRTAVLIGPIRCTDFLDQPILVKIFRSGHPCLRVKNKGRIVNVF